MTRPRRRQSGEGGISEYKLKSGEVRYLIKYSVPDPDGGGSRVVLRRGFTTRKLAAAELRKVMAEIAENRHAIPSKITLGEYLSRQWLPALRLAASTEASYRRNVRLHVLPRIGSVKLTELTASRLTGFYRELEQEGRADATGGLSARTVRYIHTILHRALRDAVEDDRLIAINPADRAKPPTNTEAKAPELKYWTTTQLGAFLTWSETEDDDLFPAWQLLVATGMRRGELLGLRWGDVDFPNSAVAIRRNAVLVREDAEDRSVERIVIKAPKSAKSRVVDVDARTVAVLKAHRQRLASIGLVHAQSDAPVFPGADGGVRHPERFSREFGRRLARARRELGNEVPKIRLHDLRHTHATALLVAGVHPKVVQERLGHANISITLDTYSHVAPTMQRQAADMFQVAVYGA